MTALIRLKVGHCRRDSRKRAPGRNQILRCLPPAATTLSPNLDQLAPQLHWRCPISLSRCGIEDLRPFTLTQAVELMEVNNPFLEAVKDSVDEAQSRLRAAIAAWYPNSI